jgi:hypothetical protein
MTFAKIACAVISAALFLSAAPLHAAPPAKVAALVHVVSAGNTCGTATVINHPLANGNPNAVISATYHGGFTSEVGGLFLNAGPLAPYYDDAATPQCSNSQNRWLIYGLDATGAFAAGQRFHVIISSP